MSWDKFKHKLLCWLSPTYKKQRRQATNDLLCQLAQSRLMILKKIEHEAAANEALYRLRRKSCQTPEESLELDVVEERLLRVRLQLETVKTTGCKFNQLDMTDINRKIQYLLK